MRLLWPDEPAFEHGVTWRVTPAIALEPAGLILNSSRVPTVAEVRLFSTRHEFRVLGLSGANLRSFEVKETVGTAADYRLRLSLDTPASSRLGSSDVEVRTDHPDQPIVKVPIFIVPGQGEGP